MMLTSTVPYLDSSLSTQSGPRWPIARCSLHWQRGRLMPTVQCVLVHSEQFLGRVGAVAGPAARSPGPKWATQPSKLWLRTKALAVNLAETHKALTNQSLQTLQRVGSIIRSTSIDCLAALGSKKGPGAAAVPGSEPPQQSPEGGDGGDEDEDSLVRASLSRFLTTASDAEVSQAARMSLLSDMAYDVSFVTPERLQEQYGLSLIAHSRSSSTPQPQLLQGGNNELQQQHLPLPQAPWPVPTVLQSAASTGPHSPDYTGLPASPRAPAVMSSYAEEDLYTQGVVPAAEFQAVTASGLYADPGSPRRPSAAAAAAAASGGVAVMGMPATPAMGGVPPSYQQQPMLLRQHSSDYYPPYGVQYPQHADEQLTLDEAALLQQLKQQEAFILLEMQASQQMMLLLQQQASILGHDTFSSAVGLSASAQDLQQLQDLTAAASTAAAAALAGSSMWDDEDDLTPGSPLSSSASAAVAAAAAEGMSSMGPAAAGAVAGAPSDWFCCDGPMSESDATPTRFFAIQGSITLDHWRINLTIDPCEFEGGALGPIRVHRGMYEAALSMYDTVLPLVQQHLAAHPQGKIALTGHSLGGSLATLLMLLMVHRGDLPLANVATVYTFGAPAVFCEGANGSPPTPGACQSCSLPCEHRKAHISASSEGTSATDSLLSKLCLPADAVVNVIMTRDIVPRAFVCDYTLVAGVLQRWLPSFKEHKGLAACKSHKALYNFVGVVEVLQPSKACDFVLPDEGHDMLPPGAALYKLTEPQQQQERAAAADSTSGTEGGRQSRRGSFNSLSSLTDITSRSLSSALAELTSSFSLGGSSGGADDDSSSSVPLGMVAVPVSDAPLAPAAMTAAGAAPESHNDVSPFAEVQAEEAPAAAVAGRPPRTSTRSSSSGGGAVQKSPEGLTLGDAILTFMNTPHPLQTLGEMRAYGHNGSISRYHNPASYSKALQELSKV